MMVNEDIDAMYKEILAYLESQKLYLSDPLSAPDEFLDKKPIELASTVAAIQKMVRYQPSLVESAVIKAYRELRSLQFEYDMRLMSRADYYSDALLEIEESIARTNYNSVTNQSMMAGD